MCHTDKIYIKIYRNMLFFYYLISIFKNNHICTFLYILHKFCQVFILLYHFILSLCTIYPYKNNITFLSSERGFIIIHFSHHKLSCYNNERESYIIELSFISPTFFIGIHTVIVVPLFISLDTFNP